MADGLPRYQHPAAGAGQFYPNQHTYQYQQRHNARNGSPVNSNRSTYANDTPSPSRSPVSQSSSHNYYPMYSSGNQQNQQVMMNGGHHQRFIQPSLGNKFQQQYHQQHHGHQNHHQQQNHTGGQGVGHQHTFSSGAGSTTTPHSVFPNLHNGHSNNGQVGLNENFTRNPLWQRQLQLAAESRQAQSQPNHHAKKEGMVSLKSRVADQPPAEDALEDGEDDRMRVALSNGTSRQDWNALDLSGQGLRAISRCLFMYEFLTKLYLDDNRLPGLDPIIGQLRRLTHLDVSHNDIRELPEEIGMLVNLKELLAFDNRLETLPKQIGNLFRLDTLGIEGNPKLDDDFKERIMRDGTKGLITYIRENADRKDLSSSNQLVSSV